ncbi:hypothetical protein ACERK3_02500 [Phycisphaerales bacterium AB-hyl4]|uniref:Uncharacterized protein n=1 Tax=Natronomicrosphaera hydrolytica TaxID=3242702 RepID=A0ABV4U1B9_9BACT
MTTIATIMDGTTVVAKHVEVDVSEDGSAWEGVFDAPYGWDARAADVMMMHLNDGRQGEFVVSRACGGDRGGAVCMVQGVGPLRRAAACRCGGHGH